MSAQKSNAESAQVDTQIWAKLAMIIGGVTLARAVQDPNLADEIASSEQTAMKEK
ncbi:hypothetical protein MED121_14309 [Marinomonas sp. MED121]|uniref:hypothetical protein n=1 Tax=Marinomonas sp. MED121 TaxID=314277 RepID=UPI0000691020|nr:hypothetical protein [Marinomonas sp. MED121]EAQ67107.1 hypothetical protein MED121_14309 [Marinomonas sp. MED121]